MLKMALMATALWALGAANPALAQEGPPKAAEPARIRFIGNGLIGLAFYKNQTCASGRGIIASRTGQKLGSALGILFRKSQNISLGMPETPNVTNLARWDVTLSKAFYREYAVNGGEPLTVRASYYYFAESRRGNVATTTTADCNSDSYFTPQAGKNYEVTLDVDRDACHLNVMEIDTGKAQVRLVPVQRKLAQRCGGAADPGEDVPEVAPVIDPANGVDIVRPPNAAREAHDKRADALLARRRAQRGFAWGAFPQCPDCPQTYASADAYKSIKLPQTGDAEADKWIQGIEPQLNHYMSSRGRSFTLPTGIVAIPCHGVEDELRKAAGFLEFDELPVERQQSFRRYASPEASYYYRDIRIWPVRAACLNGKLHGEVEIWAFANQVSHTAKHLSVLPSLLHLRFTAENGKPVGTLYTATRSEGADLVVYYDPADAPSTRKFGKFRHESMTYKFWHADKEANPRTVKVVNSIYEDERNQKVLYESAQTSVTLPLGPGRTELLSYDGARKTSRYLAKAGQLHGEALSFAKPAADGAIAVSKSCFKDGEKVKLDPCSVD